MKTAKLPDNLHKILKLHSARLGIPVQTLLETALIRGLETLVMEWYPLPDKVD